MNLRPPRLAYSAREGLYETHYTPFDGEDTDHDDEKYRKLCLSRLQSFIDKALDWSRQGAVSAAIGPGKSIDENVFCILDTFLSDSVTDDFLVRVLDVAEEVNAGVHFLLVDPVCRFARARAKSISKRKEASSSEAESQTSRSETESQKGLSLIHKAIFKKIKAPGLYNEDLPYNELAAIIGSLGKACRVELKFYDRIASGPLFLFRDILLAGRFGAQCSSTVLPWSMVVDDPGHREGVYRAYFREYQRLWDDAEYDLKVLEARRGGTDSA